MPRSEKEPFLYLTIIGPCGRLVAAINETPVLSKMKKCILFYSGTYNLRNSGDLHKWCTDDQNVIIDMSRAVFFKGEPSLEGGEPDALKNLCSLLGPEKSGLWATIKEKSPSKFKAFQAFVTDIRLLFAAQVGKLGRDRRWDVDYIIAEHLLCKFGRMWRMNYYKYSVL